MINLHQTLSSPLQRHSHHCMMKNSSTPPYHWFDHNPKDNNVDLFLRNENDNKVIIFRCDLYAREFTYDNTPSGHKTYYRASNLLQAKIKKPRHYRGSKMCTLKIKHSCDVCNKVFSSNKALNGHMKCHDKRGLKKSIIHSPTTDRDLLPPIDF